MSRGDERVLHPEAIRDVALEHEQHAIEFTEIGDTHQALGAQRRVSATATVQVSPEIVTVIASNEIN